MDIVLSKRFLYLLEALVVALVGSATWVHVLETWPDGFSALIYGVGVLAIFVVFRFLLLRIERPSSQEETPVQQLGEPMSTPAAARTSAAAPEPEPDSGPLEVPATSEELAAGSEEPTAYTNVAEQRRKAAEAAKQSEGRPMGPAAGSEEPTEYTSQPEQKQPEQKQPEPVRPKAGEAEATEAIAIELPQASDNESSDNEPSDKGASNADQPEAGTPEATERVDLAGKLAALVEKNGPKKDEPVDDSPDKTTRVDISEHIDS